MSEVKTRPNLIYCISAIFLLILFKIFYRLSVTGQDNIPETGTAVLVANHTSFLDPPIVAVSCKRHISFMAKAELFKVPILGTLLRLFEAFPVNRNKMDLKAFRTAFRRLKQGRLLGVFPEGTRRRVGPKKMGPLEPGAAYLILKSGTPIIPVGISGTDKVIPTGKRLPRFPKVTVAIGKPIHFKIEKPSQESISEVTGRIEKNILGLLV